MSVSDIFTLNNSIAPKLVRILYVIALVLIAIGVVVGAARGIATMARGNGPRVAVIRQAPPPPVTQAATAPAQAAAPGAAPASPPAPEAATETPPAQTTAPAASAPLPQQGRGMMRRALRDGVVMGPGMMGPGFRGGMMGPGQRFGVRAGRGGGRDAMLVGALQIVRSIVAGVIAVFVVRILAEMALGVLRMGEKAKSV